jgi:hypothetical protein
MKSPQEYLESGTNFFVVAQGGEPKLQQTVCCMFWENYLNSIIRKKNTIPRIRRNAQRTNVIVPSAFFAIPWKIRAQKIVTRIQSSLKLSQNLSNIF